MSAGWVYLLDRGDGVYKVGRSSGYDSDRIAYATATYGEGKRFKLTHRILTDDAPALESAIHYRLRDYRITRLGRRRPAELFALPKEEVELMLSCDRIDRAQIPAHLPTTGSRGGRPRAAEGPKKERISSYLPIELMERARNAAYWTPGLSVAAMLEAGLRAELEKRERKNGGPFSTREGDAE